MSGHRLFDDGLRLEVLPDAAAVAARGSEWLAERLGELIRADGCAVLAISGGRSPWPMFRKLVGNAMIAWGQVHIVQVDERVAPLGDPDRNWTMVMEVFGGVVAETNLHAMPVEEGSLKLAADKYASLIDTLSGGRGVGIVHLGLGGDGHTASLFPHDEVLDVQDRDVAMTSGPHAGRRRMTLTFQAIGRAQHILWQVQGSSKATMLRTLINQDVAIPASRVRRDTALVLADAAAASCFDDR
jgi:6-phosphogluconolactonase